MTRETFGRRALNQDAVIRIEGITDLTVSCDQIPVKEVEYLLGLIAGLEAAVCAFRDARDEGGRE